MESSECVYTNLGGTAGDYQRPLVPIIIFNNWGGSFFVIKDCFPKVIAFLLKVDRSVRIHDLLREQRDR
ncbi:leucyl-tRNA synthetase [Bacillus sp. SG-1]|nr:leucyl-tRNA synthetase [Bacillus sp. SG-1]